MPNSLFAALAALVAGISAGLQPAVLSRMGAMVSPVVAGLLVNVAGGSIAMVMLMASWRRSLPPGSLANTGQLAIVGGALGILVVTGVGFAVRHLGLVAGVGVLIVGQMAVAVLIDVMGWGLPAPIPLTLGRVLGVLMLCVGAFLVLPRAE